MELKKSKLYVPNLVELQRHLDVDWKAQGEIIGSGLVRFGFVGHRRLSDNLQHRKIIASQLKEK